jgi:hypothetical protein|tara:strand:- start:542 stop:1093 length:552 start_codon:yes stop_codon:yes gene_type:complete
MVDTPIVSETLQNTFRTNFPSQISSGRDLHVSDVIIPTVDFSTVAGTTGISQSLQEAVDLTITTIELRYNVSTSTVTINTPGFWYYNVYANTIQSSSASDEATITIDDGTTTKTIFSNLIKFEGTASVGSQAVRVNQYVYLRSGDSLKFNNANTVGSSAMIGYARQIADTTGTLINPNGFVST